jgi:hypothetical protein
LGMTSVIRHAMNPVATSFYQGVGRGRANAPRPGRLLVRRLVGDVLAWRGRTGDVAHQ